MPIWLTIKTVFCQSSNMFAFQIGFVYCLTLFSYRKNQIESKWSNSIKKTKNVTILQIGNFYQIVCRSEKHKSWLYAVQRKLINWWNQQAKQLNWHCSFKNKWIGSISLSSVDLSCSIQVFKNRQQNAKITNSYPIIWN